jgi:hypothetical protein
MDKDMDKDRNKEMNTDDDIDTDEWKQIFLSPSKPIFPVLDLLCFKANLFKLIKANRFEYLFFIFTNRRK